MNIQLNTCVRKDHDHQTMIFEKFVYGLSLYMLCVYICYHYRRICKLQNIMYIQITHYIVFTQCKTYIYVWQWNPFDIELSAKRIIVVASQNIFVYTFCKQYNRFEHVNCDGVIVSTKKQLNNLKVYCTKRRSVV